MKRSEMVMIIAEAQSDCPDMDTAEYILEAIEEAGMLPPNQLNGCVNNIRCEWEDESPTGSDEGAINE